jgi:hypothetical protein
MRYVITKYWNLYYADVNIKHNKALLLFRNDAHNHKITGILKQLKIPTVASPCTAHPHKSRVCCHDIDHVMNDDNIES